MTANMREHAGGEETQYTKILLRWDAAAASTPRARVERDMMRSTRPYAYWSSAGAGAGLGFGAAGALGFGAAGAACGVASLAASLAAPS